MSRSGIVSGFRRFKPALRHHGCCAGKCQARPCAAVGSLQFSLKSAEAEPTVWRYAFLGRSRGYGEILNEARRHSGPTESTEGTGYDCDWVEPVLGCVAAEAPALPKDLAAHAYSAP